MYNRYIPQPDGSYRRNPTPEQRQQRQPQKSPSPPPVSQRPTPPPMPQRHPPQPEPIPGFLRQLIPQGFDTGDLIVVLLLLLIAGDSREQRSNALLTLALYFVL